MIKPTMPASLMKQLAIPLSNHKTVAKWLVITQTPLRAPRLALHSQPTHAAESMLSEIPYSSRTEREQTSAYASFKLYA